MDLIRKSTGKSVTIKIDSDLQRQIKSEKDHLRDLYDNEEELSPLHRASIKVILNDLDDYDLNILLAHFIISGGKDCYTAKLFGVSPSTIKKRIEKIIDDIRSRVIDSTSDNSICD